MSISSGGICGHLGSKSKDLKTFTYSIPKLISWSRDYEKSVFRGHPRSSNPKLGVFRVISGQNLKIFKLWQIIDQNEALWRVVTKKWFPRSPEVIRQKKVHKRKGDRSTNYLERSESLRRETGLPITWSEARGLEEEIDPPIAFSEARDQEEQTSTPLASTEARG